MQGNWSTDAEKIGRFWGKYLSELEECRVRPDAGRWYVRRAEAFVQAMKPRRLAELGPADVCDYLAEMGRAAGIKDWQLAQIVDAVQILLELARVPWVESADWQGWRDGARSLPAQHPTVARDYDAGLVAQHEPRSQEGLAALRVRHTALVQRFVAAIRVRGMAIRTEQSYLEWVLRFLAFHRTRR